MLVGTLAMAAGALLAGGANVVDFTNNLFGSFVAVTGDAHQAKVAQDIFRQEIRYERSLQIREDIRDVNKMMLESVQSHLFMGSIILGVCFTLFVEGYPPENTNRTMSDIWLVFTSWAATFTLLSLWLALCFQAKISSCARERLLRKHRFQMPDESLVGKMGGSNLVNQMAVYHGKVLEMVNGAFSPAASELMDLENDVHPKRQRNTLPALRTRVTSGDGRRLDAEPARKAMHAWVHQDANGYTKHTILDLPSFLVGETLVRNKWVCKGERPLHIRVHGEATLYVAAQCPSKDTLGGEDMRSALRLDGQVPTWPVDELPEVTIGFHEAWQGPSGFGEFRRVDGFSIFVDKANVEIPLYKVALRSPPDVEDGYVEVVVKWNFKHGCEALLVVLRKGQVHCKEEDWPIAEFNDEIKQIMPLRDYSGIYMNYGVLCLILGAFFTYLCRIWVLGQRVIWWFEIFLLFLALLPAALAIKYVPIHIKGSSIVPAVAAAEHPSGRSSSVLSAVLRKRESALANDESEPHGDPIGWDLADEDDMYKSFESNYFEVGGGKHSSEGSHGEGKHISEVSHGRNREASDDQSARRIAPHIEPLSLVQPGSDEVPDTTDTPSARSTHLAQMPRPTGGEQMPPIWVSGAMTAPSPVPPPAAAFTPASQEPVPPLDLSAFGIMSRHGDASQVESDPKQIDGDEAARVAKLRAAHHATRSPNCGIRFSIEEPSSARHTGGAFAVFDGCRPGHGISPLTLPSVSDRLPPLGLDACCTAAGGRMQLAPMQCREVVHAAKAAVDGRTYVPPPVMAVTAEERRKKFMASKAYSMAIVEDGDSDDVPIDGVATNTPIPRRQDYGAQQSIIMGQDGPLSSSDQDLEEMAPEESRVNKILRRLPSVIKPIDQEIMKDGSRQKTLRSTLRKFQLWTRVLHIGFVLSLSLACMAPHSWGTWYEAAPWQENSAPTAQSMNTLIDPSVSQTLAWTRCMIVWPPFFWPTAAAAGIDSVAGGADVLWVTAGRMLRALSHGTPGASRLLPGSANGLGLFPDGRLVAVSGESHGKAFEIFQRSTDAGKMENTSGTVDAGPLGNIRVASTGQPVELPLELAGDVVAATLLSWSGNSQLAIAVAAGAGGLFLCAASENSDIGRPLEIFARLSPIGGQGFRNVTALHACEIEVCAKEPVLWVAGASGIGAVGLTTGRLLAMFYAPILTASGGITRDGSTITARSSSSVVALTGNASHLIAITAAEGLGPAAFAVPYPKLPDGGVDAFGEL